MKKFLSIMLLAIMMVGFSTVFTSCSDDDDEVSVTTEQVIGKWNVTWVEEDGESIDIPRGLAYMILRSDGTYRTVFLDYNYIGEWQLKGNTVVGTTLDPITEYYKFTSLNGKNAEIYYSNSEGTRMKFRATKE